MGLRPWLAWCRPLAGTPGLAALLLSVLLLLAVRVAAEPTSDPAPVAPPKAPATAPAAPTLPPVSKLGPPNVSVLQLMEEGNFRNYPYALSSLLKMVGDRTTIKVNPEPRVIRDFTDPALFTSPFVYANFADRDDWTFRPEEQENIRRYLERGGFIFVDAGITAEFLRGDPRFGQHHSFADWQAHPQLEKAFQSIWPAKRFKPVPRSHPLFRAVYQGLPDASKLADTVRDYVLTEKWPEGTYSAVALELDDRVAVLATPIIAMGWGKDQLGNWETTIGFRIRESAPALGERLQDAAYSGERYQTRREDGGVDIIFCQEEALPAWVHEPDDRWRVFRYYHSREISDFAHVFYTQLGANILVYALTH